MPEDKQSNITNEEEMIPVENVEEDASDSAGNEAGAADRSTGESGDDESATQGSGAQEPTIEEQLIAAREESKSNYDRYLRSVAEMENYRRRSLREKEEARKYAASSLVEELLPVLDNFVLGLESAKKHPEAKEITHGFEMVYRQINSILKEHGVEEIYPLGEEFDPHRHESTGYEPDDELPEGSVVRVIRRGYALNDRLLRPAMVVLSSGSGVVDRPREDSGARNPESDESGEQSPEEK